MKIIDNINSDIYLLGWRIVRNLSIVFKLDAGDLLDWSQFHKNELHCLTGGKLSPVHTSSSVIIHHKGVQFMIEQNC